MQVDDNLTQIELKFTNVPKHIFDFHLGMEIFPNHVFWKDHHQMMCQQPRIVIWFKMRMKPTI